MAKIGIIGAGGIGLKAAEELAIKEHDVLIFNRTEKKEVKELQARTKVAFTTAIDEVSKCDIIIYTAGKTREPGQSRADLVRSNLDVLRTYSASLLENNPNATIIIVANPLDTLTTAIHIESLDIKSFKGTIIGSGSDLDTERAKCLIYIAIQEIQEHQQWSAERKEEFLANRDVFEPAIATIKNVWVIGGHHNQMVLAVTDKSTYQGELIQDILPTDTLQEIEKETRSRGAAIIERIQQKGLSRDLTTHPPALSAVRLVSLMTGEKNDTISCYIPANDIAQGGIPHSFKSGDITPFPLILTDPQKAALALSKKALREELDTVTTTKVDTAYTSTKSRQPEHDAVACLDG